MWGETNIGSQYKTEELSSQKKFDALRSGINVSNGINGNGINGINGNEIITLDTIINSSTTNWLETEWEFPKGRRNFQEKDLDCALREFEEETGYSRDQIKVVENLYLVLKNF